MGFHGTPILAPVTLLTPPLAGTTIPAGGFVEFGGLSSYQELVIGAVGLTGVPINLEVQFYALDDETLIDKHLQPLFSKESFTSFPGVDGIWRIPISSGSVRILNNASVAQDFIAYISMFGHDTVLQEPDAAMPRVFIYSGALPNGGTVVLGNDDGLADYLTMSGPCTICVRPSAAVNGFLQARFYRPNGNSIPTPICPNITGVSVFPGVAVPVVPTQLEFNSSLAVTSVTLTVTVIPENPT